MCTAISFTAFDHYFGRNLDLEYCYKESVTVTPRNYPFEFRHAEKIPKHYSLIGVATVVGGYPLYYDGTNEEGLSMAGLNFHDNAYYGIPVKGKYNIAPFELIPWILCQCKTVKEAQLLLERTNLTETAFSPALPNTPLHWIVSDRTQSITVEPMKEGLVIQDNYVGVLTNNPPFDYHLHHLKNYLQLSNQDPENHLAPGLLLHPYSRGMGAMGLPGDLSSASRFIRGVFTKFHSQKPKEESAAVAQFFHILSSVSMTDGTVKVGNSYEKTVYTSCCNTDRGIYYYTTYENSQITAVHLHHENIDSDQLVCYSLRRAANILKEN